MLYLVMREYRVENVCGEFAPNALKSARSQVQQLDVHLQAFDRLLVEAALLAVHREQVLVGQGLLSTRDGRCGRWNTCGIRRISDGS